MLNKVRIALATAGTLLASTALQAQDAVPTCAAPPASGEKLAGDMKLVEEGHRIDISNVGGADSLVKLRHADTLKLAASFFIRRAEEMEIEGVPDGNYVLQYAFGPSLAADCRSFTRIIKASQMPGSDDLKTETIDDADHTEVKRQTVSYSLFVEESMNNVKPVDISAAAFNAD